MSVNETEVPSKPDFKISNSLFTYLNGPASNKPESLATIMQFIKEQDMAPYYIYFAHQIGIKVDQSLLESIQSKNVSALKSFEDRLEDAKLNLGETEVSQVLIAKAHYLAQIGEKEVAITAYRVAVEKTVPLGSRIDLTFAMMRLGFFYRDNDIIQRNIQKAKSLIEEGGDWDRRNRMKVYEGIFKVSNRDFKGAVNLLLDSLATFSSPEFMEYKEFVKYTVLVSTLTLDRPTFQKKIVNSPEILEVLHEIPHLNDFANSIYMCNYALFFKSLAMIEQHIKYDPFLQIHTKYYVREIRIAAYNQILESYRSLTMESMAKSFGVSEDFIDSDLSRFIAAGRIHAVIDKVGMVVETNRPDSKNAQYQETIKQGDLLLNRIQKLGRVINI